MRFSYNKEERNYYGINQTLIVCFVETERSKEGRKDGKKNKKNIKRGRNGIEKFKLSKDKPGQS